ncbi:type I pantothenate kinase [Demequina sp. NBRC 110055]|uniref:type I pantothenate kinase n=1 Tax=Demequina sp. NBRC 110055 TaxID=1570344 RepID=UPI000A008A92|nr:type I pantothenate kinase [Demequina sp. NBRC 110055]
MVAVSPRTSPASDGPFTTFSRDQWAALATTTPLPLTQEDIRRVRGLGDPIDLAEVDKIYRPLSRLLDLYSGAIGGLHSATSAFLGESTGRTPYVIGIAGSVAVGKSTTARVLRELMARWPHSPRVELITTDGFLHPNAVLAERGLLQRKGFPESYDRRALRQFIADVKSGVDEVSAPVYSHITYDIVPGERAVVRRPDILIVEGLNVLQPASPRDLDETALAVSDYFDVSIYVDAEPTDVRRWYIDRFLSLRSTAFSRPDSYFLNYADLTDEEAVEKAGHIWDSINAPNLARNIAPTRSRATIILSKGADHQVQSVHMRKL